MTTEERFWSKVNKDGPNGCWLWTAGKWRHGYGRFVFRKNKQEGTHRISWMLFRGKIPAGMYVCHKCDEPRCVNPDHLFLGTQYDNMRDMARKGRKRPATGEGHGRAKLTEAEVRKMRALVAQGEVQARVAEQFGVSVGNVSMIAARKTWGNVN